jgi:hypothetical protein
LAWKEGLSAEQGRGVKMSDLGKQLQSIPIWIPNAIMLIIVVVLLLVPIGLPIGVSPQTRDIYNAIEAIPSGSVVVFHHQFHGSNFGELAGAGSAMLKQLFAKDLKVVVVTQSNTGPAFYSIYWTEPETYDMPGNREETLQAYNKEYGVDYVEFGYLTGGESGARLLADDFHAAYPKDIDGTDIADLPMMENIKGAADVHTMIILHSWESYNKYWLRQWQGRFGTQTLCVASGLVYPTLAPYYPHQQLFTAGLRASGEYENLMGYQGIGTKYGDAFSLGAVLMIIMVILGNAGQFMEKGGRQ